MNYTQRLEKSVQESQNCICMGMDPVLHLIPTEASSPEEKIKKFYLDLLDEFIKRGIRPAAVKPNSAYYECISIQAQLVLQELIAEYQKAGILVVLDAKRGDIGKSSAAYATAAFDVFGADCVTASPYMGSDSLKPFLQHNLSKGVYSLLRTSNKGAADFQDVQTQDQESFFYTVARRLMEWDNGSLGAVVGATNEEELAKITSFFVDANHEMPFLIPGVSIAGVPGQQGGDGASVLKIIRGCGAKKDIYLLNSSSGLNYAWQARESIHYAVACADAFEGLCESIQKV